MAFVSVHPVEICCNNPGLFAKNETVACPEANDRRVIFRGNVLLVGKNRLPSPSSGLIIEGFDTCTEMNVFKVGLVSRARESVVALFG